MKRKRRRWRIAIITVACGLVLFAGASALLAWLFTAPGHAAIGDVGDLPFTARAVEFRTEDDLTIRGWYAPSTADSGVVVLLHGYLGNRTHMLPRARMLRDAGYGVLLYDARGCGTSDGSLISMGYYEHRDLLAAMRYLHEQGEHKIACIGVSQGGATIAFAAGKLGALRGAICESTYDDMDHAIDRRLRQYALMPGWLGACVMRPIGEMRLGCSISDIAPVRTIGKLPCPVYIISGDHDTRVWPQDTRRLFAAASNPRQLWMIPGADHQDLYEYTPSEYRKNILEFLYKCLSEDD